MDFGYKTSWIATRAASPERLADALGLVRRTEMDAADGTRLAYQQGVYVIRPVPDWTFAHSRTELTPGDAEDPDFTDWLLRFGAEVGDFQLFENHRSADYYGWARFDGGSLTRAHFLLNSETPICVGARTEVEVELGVGYPEPGVHDRRDLDARDGAEREVRRARLPDEEVVLRIAESWGLSPQVPAAVGGSGIHGWPGWKV